MTDGTAGELDNGKGVVLPRGLVTVPVGSELARVPAWDPDGAGPFEVPISSRPGSMTRGPWPIWTGPESPRSSESLRKQRAPTLTTRQSLSPYGPTPSSVRTGRPTISPAELCRKVPGDASVVCSRTAGRPRSPPVLRTPRLGVLPKPPQPATPISARPAPRLKLRLTFLCERTPPTPTTALKGSGTMTADELGPVIERELALMSPSVRRSVALVDELLDPEFREIGMSGRCWTRPEAIQALASEATDESCAAEMTDIEGTVLEPNLVLLTYVSSRGGRRARRSSLWRCSDGNWRLVLHQGTPI